MNDYIINKSFLIVIIDFSACSKYILPIFYYQKHLFFQSLTVFQIYSVLKQLNDNDLHRCSLINIILITILLLVEFQRKQNIRLITK